MNRKGLLLWSAVPLPAAIAALALLVASAVLAVGHLRDLSSMRDVVGIWMALAQYLNDGVLYPPVADAGHYAGTRYMPLLFVLIAGLERLVGDYLLAVKLSALLSVALLLVLVFVAARRATARSLDAVALTGLVLAFPQGLGALLSPHADALPVALALAGLLLLERADPGPARSLLAALLFAAAVLTKFSSLAAPAAAAAFLFTRCGPRHALRVLLPFAATLAVALAALQLASDGRFLDNFRWVGSGGGNFDSLRLGPARLRFRPHQAHHLSARLARRPAQPVLRAPARPRPVGLVRRFQPRHHLADLHLARHRSQPPARAPGRRGPGARSVAGAGGGEATPPPNPLPEAERGSQKVDEIDEGERRDVSPPVRPQGERRDVSPPVGGVTGGRTPRRSPFLPPLSAPGRGLGGGVSSLALRALVLGALLLGLHDLRAEADSLAAPSPRDLADSLPTAPHLLAEDPSSAVLFGRRPVVMDSFNFRVLAERGRIDDSGSAARVERHEFDALVLMGRIDRPGESLCPHFRFGPLVTDAMRRSYRFDRQVGCYFLFLPAR